jgi:HSP20 family protein
MAQHNTFSSLPVQWLAQEVDRLFDELIHRRWGLRSVRGEEWSPQLDVYETAREFILEADLPGVKEHEVSVTVEAGDLVLQGQRAFEEVSADQNFYYRERRSGRFVRRLRLPASVAQDRIRAEFRDGVLRVILPKRSHTERKVQR